MFRISAIIGSLPNTIANGQTVDAVPVMADFNYIVSQVNANAAPLSNTALLDAANSFTAVQSGISATSAANFPIASQVQNSVFTTLSSTLGTNSLTGRVAALPLTAYAVGQVFTFIPNNVNSGAATLNIDSVGQGAIQSYQRALVGGELGSNPASVLVTAITPVFELLNPPPGARNTLVRARGDILVGKAQYQLGTLSVGNDGTFPMYLGSEPLNLRPALFGSGLAVSGAAVALNYAVSSTQVTGTSIQLPLNPGVQHQHPSAAKAWGLVTTPSTMSTSYPAGATVTRDAAGQYTVTHGRTFADTNYVVNLSADDGTPANFTSLAIVLRNRTPTIFEVFFYQAGVAADPRAFHYTIYGTIT